MSLFTIFKLVHYTNEVGLILGECMEEIESTKLLNRNFKKAKLVGLMIMGGAMFITGLGYFLNNFTEVTKSTSIMQSSGQNTTTIVLLRVLLLLVAIGSRAYFELSLRKIMVKKVTPAENLEEQSKDVEKQVKSLFSMEILNAAFSEAIAIYGLIMVLLGGNNWDLVLFGGLSLGMFLRYFPRKDRWEEELGRGGSQ